MKGLITIWILVIVSGIGAFSVFNYLTQPAGAVTCTGHCNQQVSNKYDGDCQLDDTTGRCADKCPSGQFQRGNDKDTGAPICSTVTGCPYGDSIPMSDCDRYAPQPTSQPQVLGTQTEQPTIDYYYGGK